MNQYSLVGDNNIQLPFIDFMMGDHETALSKMDEADALYFDNSFYLMESAKYYYYMGEYEKSKKNLDRYLVLTNYRTPIINWLEAVHAENDGDSAQVMASLEALKAQMAANASGSPAWFIALYHCHIKDYDTMFKWLNKSYDRREVELTWFKEEPMLQPLKTDARYIELYNKIGFDVIEPLTQAD